MKFWVITDTTLPRTNEDMVVLPCFEHDFDGNFAQTESVRHFNNLANGALLKHASVRSFEGRNGQTMLHFLSSSILSAQKALLMGVGKSTEVTLQSLQTAVKEAFKQIGTDKAEQVTFDLKPLLVHTTIPCFFNSVFDSWTMLVAFRFSNLSREFSQATPAPTRQKTKINEMLNLAIFLF